ncbi:hypothetical protein [Streptomyces mirabilis]|uniref:hypothetical protein n=1 Tax=Streptomyces mirabilis TaxID=68239 RepID=UPI0036A8776F
MAVGISWTSASLAPSPRAAWALRTLSCSAAIRSTTLPPGSSASALGLGACRPSAFASKALQLVDSMTTDDISGYQDEYRKALGSGARRPRSP